MSVQPRSTDAIDPPYRFTRGGGNTVYHDCWHGAHNTCQWSLELSPHGHAHTARSRDGFRWVSGDGLLAYFKGRTEPQALRLATRSYALSVCTSCPQGGWPAA